MTVEFRATVQYFPVVPSRGGGYSVIWAIRGRAAGQGVVFWLRRPKQGVQFDLPLS